MLHGVGRVRAKKRAFAGQSGAGGGRPRRARPTDPPLALPCAVGLFPGEALPPEAAPESRLPAKIEILCMGLGRVGH